jgi:hypothetical protein
MKRYLIPIVLLALLFSGSCKQKAPITHVTSSQFSNLLTPEEKAGGVMTPEIMWKFGSLGTFTLSPDGSAVLYTVTDIDLQTEARRTNIFKLSTAGGDPFQLTSDGGASPQWFDSGKSIAFVNKGNLCTMGADGSGQKVVTGLNDCEIFSISPAGNMIYFTKRVKMDQTANEKHSLPKANVRIINDLMYRHWNSWSDFSYSIFLLPHLMEVLFQMKKTLWKGSDLNPRHHLTSVIVRSHGVPMASLLLIPQRGLTDWQMLKAQILIYSFMK